MRQFEHNPHAADAGKYKADAPEPRDERDADDSMAADYAASCETRLNQANTTGKGVKNIEQIADDM